MARTTKKKRRSRRRTTPISKIVNKKNKTSRKCNKHRGQSGGGFDLIDDTVHPMCSICQEGIETLMLSDNGEYINRVRRGAQEPDAAVYKQNKVMNRSEEQPDDIDTFPMSDSSYTAFHRRCIDKWIERNPEHPTNPVTRGLITEYDPNSTPFPYPFNDGSHFIAGALTNKGKVRMWCANGETKDIDAFRGTVVTFGMAMSDDGRIIAMKGSGSKLMLWDVTTETFVGRFDAESRRHDIGLVSFIGNDRVVIGNKQGQVTVYGVRGGRWIRMNSWDRRDKQMVFDIVGMDPVDQVTAVYDRNTDEHIFVAPQPVHVITSGLNGDIEVYDMDGTSKGSFSVCESGEEFVVMRVHGSRLFVATNHVDPDAGSVEIWEKIDNNWEKNHPEQRCWRLGDYIHDISVSDNGNRMFVSFENNKIEVWDVGANPMVQEKELDVEEWIDTSDSQIKSIGDGGEYVLLCGRDRSGGKVVVLDVSTESPVIVGDTDPGVNWIGEAVMGRFVMGGGDGKRKRRHTKKFKTRGKRRSSRRR